VTAPSPGWTCRRTPHASVSSRSTCAFVVKAGAGRDPQHGLRVLVNGAQEWARRLPTQREGEDSLEWRQRRSVPVGQALRIQALSEVQHALRLRLVVSAVED
jgi:hypothetical protein